MSGSSILPTMSTVEVPSQNGLPESFDSSDFSLIPDPSEAPGAMGYSTNSQFGMSFLSAASDMSVEEIQKRLVELVQDNESMKEALKNNNKMMKEQLNTITEWHNQMTTSMSNQKMTLMETQEKLSEAQNENLELKKRMQELKDDSKVVKDNETCTNSDNMSLSNEEFDFEFVNRKKAKEEESIKEELKAAYLLINQLREENIEQMKKVSETQTAVDEKEKKHTKNFADAQSEVLLLKAEIEKIGSDVHDKVEELEVSHSEIKRLQRIIDDLNVALSQEQQEKEKEKAHNAETKIILQATQEKYEKAVKSLEEHGRYREDEEEMERTTKMYLEKIDELTATNFDLEQKLDKRTEDMRKLSEELDSVKKETEAIPILKAQVEEYKSELDHAHLSKESAQEEAERAKKELAEFQVVVSLCQNCGTVNDHSITRSVQEPAPPPEFQVSPYNCPVCGFGFDNLQAAENHVNTCLDNAQ